MEKSISLVNRREFIVKCVTDKIVTSQRQLSKMLVKEGIVASQSTLSRDIEALGIIKDSNGKMTLGDGAKREKQRELLIQLLTNEEGYVVTKTRTFFLVAKNRSAEMIGHLLEELYEDKILGTLATEGGLLVIVNGDTYVSNSLKKEIRNLIKKGIVR
ncbi:hypothetical protein [Paenibacillus sp. 2KB_22]|uniref:hypothetical protein n=1 Tax=Paenibacillus sp. 2KB_22 TaxID=3232978 RepID=UPI003F9BEF4C